MTASPVVRRTPHRADPRGLTLLELLLVLALLTALGALVLPAALSIRDAASWSSDRLRLRAMLAEARLTAIEQGQVMLVQFEAGERIRVRPFVPTADDDTQADPVIDMPAMLELPEDEPDPALLAVMLPDGQARVHQPIVLRDAAGHRAAASIDALTGHIGLLDLPDAVDDS